MGLSVGIRGREINTETTEATERRSPIDLCGLGEPLCCRPTRAAWSTFVPMADTFAIAPPIEPMLAKLADELPPGGTFLYEPKWDGFRAIVFRGGADVFIQSRDCRPLDRYFPELHALFLERLPPGCVLDGEIVIATPRGLDFEALQLRLHPAASR